MKLGLSTPDGHILCVMLIFAVGCLLYVANFDYGKEVMAGALGSLWTLIQLHRTDNVVNQAETITVENKQN